MPTFLSGGTGTPKLLRSLESVFDPTETTIVANTGDDVELGGLLVCPDLDTVLYERADELDVETWWGRNGDTAITHDELKGLADRLNVPDEPRYLDEDAQVEGRDIARWRRFSGVYEFMHIGDLDRAVHVLRTSLIDEGNRLTTVAKRLADAFDVTVDVLPMSDDPVASIIQTPSGPQHFQSFWVANEGKPAVDSVEFRGGEEASATPEVLEAIRERPVIIGPSNPVTSIGPMLELDGFEDALYTTTVVAVSPFIEETVFSGPAAKLMEAVGYSPSTAGMAEAYPFVDAFVLDDADSTNLDRPVVRTETTLSSGEDAERVLQASKRALEGARVPD